MSSFYDFLGGAKPIAPPSVYGEVAGNAAGGYRDLLKWFNSDLKPYIDGLKDKFPELIEQTNSELENIYSEYSAQNPNDKEFAGYGRDIEGKTLREIRDAGSQERQNELGTAARERARGFLDTERDASEAQSFGYGRQSKANIGLTDAQSAAALAVAENDAISKERYRGEDVRRGSLNTANTYREGVGNRFLQKASIRGSQADLVASAADGYSGLLNTGADFYNNQVTDAGDTSVASASFHHDAQNKYQAAKAARSSRILKNVVSIGSAAFGNPSALAGLELGGTAGGEGSFNLGQVPGVGNQLRGFMSSGNGYRNKSRGGTGGIGGFRQSPGAMGGRTRNYIGV